MFEFLCWGDHGASCSIMVSHVEEKRGGFEHISGRENDMWHRLTCSPESPTRPQVAHDIPFDM